MTTVVSVRGRDRDTLLSDPDFVYCGRPIYRGSGTNWKGSIWANPFRVGLKREAAIRILGRDIDYEPRAVTVDLRLCLGFYRAWLRDRPEMVGRIPELKGKTLGCWCCDWEPGKPVITPCHAIVLAKLAEGGPRP